MARLTATQTFNTYLEGTEYHIDRAGMYFRMWRGDTSVKGCRSAAQMTNFLFSRNLSCEIETTTQGEIESYLEDITPADVLVWDCTGSTEDGVEYRHIEIRAISEGGFDAGDMTVNVLAPACALPNFDTAKGWRHGWTCPSGQRCPLESRSIYVGITPEIDYHAQHLALGWCFQTMPSGVVHVYDPQGNPHISTDIHTADSCIRLGVWNAGQQCLIEPSDNVITRPSVLSGNVPTQEQYRAESGFEFPSDAAVLIANGYNPDVFYLNPDGTVKTLEGDIEMGDINKVRW